MIAKLSHDGQTVVLDVTEEVQDQRILFRIRAEEIGVFSTGLLQAAMSCAKRTGSFSEMRPERSQKQVYAHDVAVAESASSSKAAVLIFAIGTTQLSIGIPKHRAAALGRALLTIGADTSMRQ